MSFFFNCTAYYSQNFSDSQNAEAPFLAGFYSLLYVLTQLCLLIPRTVACQAPLFMKFSRHEHWIAIPFSRGSSQPRDQTWVSCIAGRFFSIWASRASVDIHRCKEHITHMPLLFIILLQVLLVSPQKNPKSLKKIFKKILFPDSNNSEWTFQNRNR